MRRAVCRGMCIDVKVGGLRLEGQTGGGFNPEILIHELEVCPASRASVVLIAGREISHGRRWKDWGEQDLVQLTG
jgi:hypothetical protein